LDEFRDAVTIKDRGSSQQVEQAAAGDSQQQPETFMPGIHPKAIRPVGALHCTLGVMSLNTEELDKAVEVLQALDVQALLRQASEQRPGETTILAASAAEAPVDQPHPSLDRPVSPRPVSRRVPPLKIDMKGLVSMHAPHKTSILYSAPADATARLYPFCLAVQKVFKDQGILVPDDRELKLHATIVNTIYAKGKARRPPRKEQQRETPDRSEASAAQEPKDVEQQEDRSQGHGPNANAPLKMDATALLERYKDFVWAENVTIDRIVICEMGAKKVMNTQGEVVSEEYTEVARVALPTAE